MGAAGEVIAFRHHVGSGDCCDMDGRPLTVAEVAQIADLESREVLLAKLACAMKGNLSKAAGLFAARASQVARLAAAPQDKRSASEAAQD